jgi:hypothetical protein
MEKKIKNHQKVLVLKNFWKNKIAKLWKSVQSNILELALPNSSHFLAFIIKFAMPWKVCSYIECNGLKFHAILNLGWCVNDPNSKSLQIIFQVNYY